MSSDNVRVCLSRASEEIEDVCETEPLSESIKKLLQGTAIQLRYLAEGGDPLDPETPIRPDPDNLDTIRNRLVDIAVDPDDAAIDENTAIRLERACDEILLAIAILDDRTEKERQLRTERR